MGKIKLDYKNQHDGTLQSETIPGSKGEYNLIADSMPRSFYSNPNIYLHRVENDELVVIAVPLLKNFGTENNRALHYLVRVSYDPE